MKHAKSDMPAKIPLREWECYPHTIKSYPHVPEAALPLADTLARYRVLRVSFMDVAGTPLSVILELPKNRTYANRAANSTVL